MRVLAVDDDLDYLEALEGHFRGAGIDLTTCTSGRHALLLLEQLRFDVVMLDLRMPVMDGQVLAQHIRRRFRHADLPIVMMTHMANVPFIRAAAPGNIDQFVDKAGEPAWLIHLVCNLAGRRAS